MRARFVFAVMAFSIVFAFYQARSCENCRPGYSLWDWCTVDLIEEDPNEGRFVLRVKCYWTCTDGWDYNVRDIPPIFYIIAPDECTEEPTLLNWTISGATDYKSYCAVFCWGSCGCGCPPCCGVSNQSYHDYIIDQRWMWGTFKIIGYFKGSVVFDHEFNFPDPHYTAKIIEFSNIELMDHTGMFLPEAATLDIIEPFGIWVTATWDDEPFHNFIWAIVKTNGTDDSLIVPLYYVQGGPEDAVYQAMLGPGVIRQMYPDPDSRFGYFIRDVLTVYPQMNGCDELPGPTIIPEARVNIANIYLIISEVNFEGNNPLCRETGGDPPTTDIPEPQWVYKGHNFPACYNRLSNINMTVDVSANWPLLHNFPVRIRGWADADHFEFGTVPRVFNMFEQTTRVTNIMSSQACSDTVGIAPITYSWTVNKSPTRPPEQMNQTGEHKIYITYDTPMANQWATPTNTLGLELALKTYKAGGEINPYDILKHITDGIYTETAPNYDPGVPADLPRLADPYELYRQHPGQSGQCNHFARFALVLAHSLGIEAWKTFVFSGQIISNTLYRDRWQNTYYYESPGWIYYRDDLYVLPLEDPQGHTGIDHGFYGDHWSFSNHVVAEYGQKAYDAVFNVIGNLEDEKASWLRYYYTAAEERLEPPTDPPGIFRRTPGENPYDLLGTLVVVPRPHDDFYHPQLGACCVNSVCVHTMHEQDCLDLDGQWYADEDCEDPYFYCPTGFPPGPPVDLSQREEDGVVVEEQKCDAPLGDWDKDAGWLFDEFVENLRGPYYDLWGYGDETFGRTRNKKKPGDYLKPPGNYSSGPWQFTDKESAWLKTVLKENMGDEYYCPQMVSFCRPYHRVLRDSSRTEYYGTLEINHRKLAFGGWFEKLAVFGFYDHYEGVDEFLKKAKEYFNLPDITGDAVRIERKDDKYFYSVLDRDARYWLRGYRIVLSDIKTNERHPWDVIELLRFYDEEFVP